MSAAAWVARRKGQRSQQGRDDRYHADIAANLVRGGWREPVNRRERRAARK